MWKRAASSPNSSTPTPTASWWKTTCAAPTTWRRPTASPARRPSWSAASTSSTPRTTCSRWSTPSSPRSARNASKPTGPATTMRAALNLLAAGLLLTAGAAGAGTQPVSAVPPQVSAMCTQFAGRISGFSSDQCRLAGLHPAPVTSSRGRPLLVRDVQPTAPGAQAPRKVLVLGGIHGDEYSAVVVAFQWIERLNGDRFQRFQWRFLPCVNPDGLLASPSTRTNANGVDLNRNFPTPDWNAQAQLYWKNKTRKDPRRFPGKLAASEPETRWVIEQIAAYKPDAIVSLH